MTHWLWILQSTTNHEGFFFFFFFNQKVQKCFKSKPPDFSLVILWLWLQSIEISTMQDFLHQHKKKRLKSKFELLINSIQQGFPEAKPRAQSTEVRDGSPASPLSRNCDSSKSSKAQMNNYKKDLFHLPKGMSWPQKVNRSSPHRDDRKSICGLFKREKSSSEMTRGETMWLKLQLRQGKRRRRDEWPHMPQEVRALFHRRWGMTDF